MVQLAPATLLPPHLSASVNSEAFVPLIPTLEMVKAEPPASLEGEHLRCAGRPNYLARKRQAAWRRLTIRVAVVPVPVSGTASGRPERSFAMVSVPTRVPVAGGVKVILTVRLATAETFQRNRQSRQNRRRRAADRDAGDARAQRHSSFVNVTVWDALVVSTTSFKNDKLVGNTTTGTYNSALARSNHCYRWRRCPRQQAPFAVKHRRGVRCAGGVQAAGGGESPRRGVVQLCTSQ